MLGDAHGDIYINPYHGVCDPFGTISGEGFLGLRRVDFSPCLVHSRIQNVHQTNARVRKCTCRLNSSNRTLLEIMRFSVHP